MKAIVYTSENGNAAVAGLAADISEAAALAALQKEHPDAKLMDAVDLPKDQDFFDAWVLTDEGVRVSMDKARELAKQKIRRIRQPMLAELDVAFQRALETSSDTSSIVVQKQKLRDATSLTDGTQTVDDLRQAIDLLKQGV